jgi:nitrile hydratase accessory protein
MTKQFDTAKNDRAINDAKAAVPGIPSDGEGPVFQEPWQAQAFAMAFALQSRGVFAWREWAAMLGEEIRKAQAAGDPDSGATYYRHWLATLERMVVAKGLTSLDALDRTCGAWNRAADRTPHGSPVELRPEDFR